MNCVFATIIVGAVMFAVGVWHSRNPGVAAGKARALFTWAKSKINKEAP